MRQACPRLSMGKDNQIKRTIHLMQNLLAQVITSSRTKLSLRGSCLYALGFIILITFPSLGYAAELSATAAKILSNTPTTTSLKPITMLLTLVGFFLVYIIPLRKVTILFLVLAVLCELQIQISFEQKRLLLLLKQRFP